MRTMLLGLLERLPSGETRMSSALPLSRTNNNAGEAVRKQDQRGRKRMSKMIPRGQGDHSEGERALNQSSSSQHPHWHSHACTWEEQTQKKGGSLATNSRFGEILSVSSV